MAEDFTVTGHGTVTRQYTQTFDITQDVEQVVWRFRASGTDSQNRFVSATAADVKIDPPDPPSPPNYGGGTGKILLYGGANYSVYLGCFSCTQYDAQSIHNQFGKYGSRYSSTSIWNHYSQYGSPYAVHSACNEYTVTPPRLVNETTRAWAELTLNRYRPYAIIDPTVWEWLQHVVCER